MKKIILIILLCIGFGLSQNMQTYCCAPPYVMQVVKPNILFTLDMTGSMLNRAAWTLNGGHYDPDRDYYGYFYPDSLYYYANSKFFKEGHQPVGALGPFPGNIMNWAVMSRIDILRKVLVGGKGQPSETWPKHTLEPQGSGTGWNCYLNVRVNGALICYGFEMYGSSGRYYLRIYHASPHTTTTITLDRPIPTGNAFYANIDVPPGDPYGMGGVFRQIADKDNDGNFDEEAPRVAIQYFSTDSDNFQVAREFWESDGQQAVSAEAFMNDVNQQDPGGYTPVGKAVFDAACYYSYVPAYYGAFYCEGRGNWKDPYYSGQGHTLQPVWCRKSFVVMLGDGESNSDSPVVSHYTPPLPAGPYPTRTLYDYDADYNPNDTRSHPGDDYAYYAHITDMRPDLPDTQSVTFYSIFCFGQGDELFEEIAKDGGFDDINNNHVPEPEEYDKNGDGIPDNYYESEDGYQLEAAILKIVNEIMSQISSGSGVSVVTPGSRTGGMTVQAQFYPRRTFPESGIILEWTGTCQGLWLDPYGWIREDNTADHTLNLQEDYVISMRWDNSERNVMVTRIQDIAGTGDPSQFDTLETVEIEDMVPVWDAGNWLWQANPDIRDIRTFIDGDGNGMVDPTEIEFFTSGNTVIYPYLGVASDTSAITLINYIRGKDYAGLRNRTADGGVWKLGDIISSGAVSVQSVIERYDFIYGDQSYIPYRDLYEDRRQVVYVGANDGMLHCFNSGIPRLLQEDPIEPMMLVDNDYDIGQELWAYIPYNLLPHLKWLQDPAYCHVYYNDLETYVTDARIFTDDEAHPNGWGTLLIGGMRLGGMTIANDVDTCGSAFFAIDVTVPDNPVPLWEFSHPDLGLTVCYSCVIKVKDSWYLVFGSGPQTCGGESTKNARIFCLDLLTGALLNTWTVADPNSFISNIFGADWGLDYTVDRIYCGSCIANPLLPGGWGGKIYRLLTKNDTNPLNWEFETVFDMQRPITAEGSIATDQYNHLWLYFGSGRFFSEIDEYDYTAQRYVGFREDTTHAMTVAGLFDVTNVVVDTNGVVHYPNGATSSFDALVDTINVTGGWWRTLLTPDTSMTLRPQGERSLTTSLVFGGAVLFTTYIPTEDICAYGGFGNLYALYFRTGTAYTDPFLLSDTLAWRPVYIHLGQGMPSEPSLYVSADQTKVFIQAGGGVVSPETGIPGLPKSGVILWKAQ